MNALYKLQRYGWIWLRQSCGFAFKCVSHRRQHNMEYTMLSNSLGINYGWREKFNARDVYLCFLPLACLKKVFGSCTVRYGNHIKCKIISLPFIDYCLLPHRHKMQIILFVVNICSCSLDVLCFMLRIVHREVKRQLWYWY